MPLHITLFIITFTGIYIRPDIYFNVCIISFLAWILPSLFSPSSFVFKRESECVPFSFTLYLQLSIYLSFFLSFFFVCMPSWWPLVNDIISQPVDLQHSTFLQLPQIFHISSAFVFIFIFAVPTFGIIISI